MLNAGKKLQATLAPALAVCAVQICFLGMAPEVRSEPKLIDLTHPFDEHTHYWPNANAFKHTKVFEGETEGGYWYESNDISASEHGGTHVDSPAHFAKGKWHIEDIPLDSLIGPGILVDVRKNAKGNPDYLIAKQDFLDWEKEHGTIPPGSIVLVRTGWEDFWPDKKKYMGTDVPGDVENLHFPGFDAEAARFLSHERKVASVGLDTPSLDYGQSKDFLAHRVFGEANIPGFESICRLSTLPPKGFRVIALPMKIGHGSGAPLRIVAEVN